MRNQISDELKAEMSDLKIRGLNIGYRNVFPRLPKDQLTQRAFDNLMVGFHKRLANWKSGLLQIENPGGMFNGKKRETEKMSGIVHTTGQNVIKDLSELANIS